MHLIVVLFYGGQELVLFEVGYRHIMLPSCGRLTLGLVACDL